MDAPLFGGPCGYGRGRPVLARASGGPWQVSVAGFRGNRLRGFRNWLSGFRFPGAAEADPALVAAQQAGDVFVVAETPPDRDEGSEGSAFRAADTPCPQPTGTESVREQRDQSC